MDQKYIDDLKLNPKHRFEMKNTEIKGARKGWDTDFYTYDEFDEDNNLVRTFTVKDSTKTYPPFTRIVSFD